jgi:RNA polymerase primary sigma factor
LARRHLQNIIETALDVIALDNERMARVLKLRYGLTDGRQRTYAEIGAELKLSVERVSQITSEGMRAIKAVLSDTKLLTDLL